MFQKLEFTVQLEQAKKSVKPSTETMPQEIVRISRGCIAREPAIYQDFIKP